MKHLMAVLLAVPLLGIALCAAKAQSQIAEPLMLIHTIPLPGLHDGDFDHFQVDVQGQRLFLAAEDNSAVEVIDLRANRLIHTIRGPKVPHSMAYNSESKKLYVVDDGGPSQVEIYDGVSYRLLGTIPMEAHADASIYDSASKLFYVGNGGKDAHEDYCWISIIDTTAGKKVGQIKVDSDRVEAMALEKSGPRMFVNMYSKNAVAVIDREKRAVIATWSIASEGRGNGPLAFDEAHHRLFVVARDPGKIVVLDSDSGKIVAALRCVGQDFSDDAVYGPRLRRLYVAGVPFANVFQQRSANNYQLLGQV
ncbi:MAG: YncE family protein, partial [Terriglobia bacterium]